MKLSILIATQGRRNKKFRDLLTKLMPQVAEHNGEIEVIAYWNNAEQPIGEIRQALVKEAQGDYVCFIDDDDGVPSYYCDEIVRLLGEDYVGFQVKLFLNEREERPVYHSIRYPAWKQDSDGFYRNITHLNPIRRSIALQGDYSAPDAGEDERWANSVAHLVHSENYTDRVMYFYYHNSRDTSFGGDYKVRPGYIRPEVNMPHFRYHPKSKERSDENSYRMPGLRFK